MDWETIIPRSTINICSTMTLTEEYLEYLELKNTRTRIRPPLPLAMPGRQSEGKGSD
jgi:hypothetical protein